MISFVLYVIIGNDYSETLKHGPHQCLYKLGRAMALKVGIIGAGIVGTTTALEVQQILRNAEITILADKLFKETTSDGAAGIFRPSVSFSGPDPETTRKWINDSFEYYKDLLGDGCGIKEISGYVFSNHSSSVVRNELLEGLVPVYRTATESELAGTWKFGAFFHTLLIESSVFLPWALSKFELGGGTVERAHVERLTDIKGRFDIVVNCSGLGARELCNDTSLVPVRGQVLKVWAPWLDHFYYEEFDTYIIPGWQGTATVGGTRNYDSWRGEVCRHEGAAMAERARRLVPRLVDAPVLSHWVGLRPHRPTVRVETQLLTNSSLPVVHNYGHGGYGVTSAPGTAKEAARLVRNLHASTCKL